MTTLAWSQRLLFALVLAGFAVSPVIAQNKSYNEMRTVRVRLRAGITPKDAWKAIEADSKLGNSVILQSGGEGFLFTMPGSRLKALRPALEKAFGKDAILEWKPSELIQDPSWKKHTLSKRSEIICYHLTMRSSERRTAVRSHLV